MGWSEEQRENLKGALQTITPIAADPQYELELQWHAAQPRKLPDVDVGYDARHAEPPRDA